VLVVLPVALSIGLAFTAYDGLSAPEWRGLANFRELAVDPLFHIALRNSLVFVALTVPLRVLIALGLALLLSRSRRGVGLYRVAVYVPTIVPSVAYALIWLWIFNPRYGPSTRRSRASASRRRPG
jgi:multiple sugar transport system permease protein